MRAFRFLCGWFLVALILGGPLAYSGFRQKHYRNFRIVQEGVLYRSGQMTLSGLQRILEEYGIRTVITFRDAEDPTKELPPDHQEELFCQNREINYVRIRTHKWDAKEGSTPPAWENVNQFLKVMDDPKNYPVLVHCFAGMHRTGAHYAIYRMEYDGWSNAEAIREMKRLGYENIDTEEDVRGFLLNYLKRK